MHLLASDRTRAPRDWPNAEGFSNTAKLQNTRVLFSISSKIQPWSHHFPQLVMDMPRTGTIVSISIIMPHVRFHRRLF